jgi:hypothetical protein
VPVRAGDVLQFGTASLVIQACESQDGLG